MISIFLLPRNRLLFAICVVLFLIAPLYGMQSYHNTAQLNDSAVVLLKGKEGKTIPIPFHVFQDTFKKKVTLLIKEQSSKINTIDCGLFDNDSLTLAAEIILFQARQRLVTSKEHFPLEKVNNLIGRHDTKKRITKSQNLLHALAFFKVGSPLFDTIVTRCKELTQAKKKELFFLQEDLIDAIEEENSYALRSEDRAVTVRRAPSTMNHAQETLYNQMNISLSKQRAIAFSLVKKQAQANPYVSVVNPYILDKTSWQDLEIICGSGSSKDTYFTKAVDHTSCQVAKALLYTRLLQPTNNRIEIEKNKEIISFFLKHTTCFDSLNRSVKNLFDIAGNQNGLLSFFQDKNDYFKKVVERYGVPDFLPDCMVKYLNSNEYAVSIWNGKDKLRLWITSGITKPIEVLHEEAPWLSSTSHLLQNISFYLPFKKVNRFNPLAASLAIANAVTKNTYIARLPEPVSLLLFNEVASIASDVIVCLMQEQHGQDVLARLDIINCLYEKLYTLSECVKTAKQITIALSQFPELKKHITCLKELELINQLPISAFDFVKQECTNPGDFDQFINKLGSGIFTPKDSSWTTTHFGRVISAYYLVNVHKEKLFAIYMALAELDMYLSLVRLYNTHKDTHHPFCLVKTIESESPCLALEDLWNPMLGTKAVKNSIYLGVNAMPKDMIITGPNEGGKSTLLRAIIFAILMTKMGLCPAKNATITPFSSIRAYLNITDDAAHDRSLFKVSTQRANELIRSALNAHLTGHSLVIFDELYNGTKPKVGETLAYGTLKYLNQKKTFSKNICIASTHYGCVQQIREEKDSDFCYWRMGDSSDGKENQYRMVPGIYTGYNGFEVAQGVNINPAIIQCAQSRFEYNNATDFNGNILYLDALEEAHMYTNFIQRLHNNDSAVLSFFHTIALSTTYYRRFFCLAEKHGFSLKELLNYPDLQGRTLLHYLAMRDIKDSELLEFLVAHGADVHVKDIKGFKPVDYALNQDLKNRLTEYLH